jgi:CBS domain-containing protein
MLFAEKEGNMEIRLHQISSKDLVTVGAEESMRTALAKMKEHKIRHLPVVEGDRVTGVLSDRIVENQLAPELKVRDCMSVPVPSIDANTPVSAVARRMIDEKVSAFLVLEKGRLTGIVTSEDLLKILARALDRRESDVELPMGFAAELERQVYESPIGPILGALSSSGI